MDFCDQARGLAEIFQRIPALEAFYASLPLFANVPSSVIQQSIIEGHLILPLLRGPRFTLYPEKDSSKWLEYISFVFPACNNLDQLRSLSPSTLLLLMGRMSSLYQIDAFMESLVEKKLIVGLVDIIKLIHEAFGIDDVRDTDGAELMTWEKNSSIMDPQQSLDTPPKSPCPDPTADGEAYFPMDRLAQARKTLNMFVTHLLDDPAVKAASKYDQHWFKTELYNFFIAQARQVAECSTLAAQTEKVLANKVYLSTTATYQRWVHSTGADSVGSPYQFAFLSILLAEGTGRDCWETAEEKYLAQSISQGVARVWRIENDIGGVRRDRQDDTVNSINFPEFATQHRPDEDLQNLLTVVAEHEKRRWKKDIETLKSLVHGNAAKEEKVRKVGVFTDCMELYGQIYIARDPWWKKADDA